MQIQILSINMITVPTAKGSYQKADTAYKNLTFQGKVEGKQIFSFGATADSFKTLSTAQPGEVYEVTVVKNDKGYLDWVKMTKAVAGEASPTTPAPAGSQKSVGLATASPAGRSTYETPEERAIKQVYIVRQSSLSTAERLLSVGAKAPPAVEKVIETARKLEDYVFSRNQGGATGFDDVPAFDKAFDNQPQVD